MSSDILISLVPWFVLLPLALFFYMIWIRERRYDRHLLMQQREREEQRIKEEAERKRQEAEDAKEEERYQQYLKDQREEEAAIRNSAGAGTGGYIVVDLPEERRSLFHDLLKGFEEYARLKGYGVSFSVDATFKNRIAFKFTLTDPGVVVGTERVRTDFKEYLDRVRRGDALDDFPVVTSIAEHEALVTTLKNRISFLQHSYNLARNSVDFYEALIRKANTMSVLPSQNIVVQTGGSLNAPSYTALNSPQALLGDGNTSDNSVRIAMSFAERREQIEGIDKVLSLLRNDESGQARDQAVHNLESIKEELEEAPKPESGRIAKWLERTRQALQLGGLGYETVQAAKELFKLFGLS